MELTQNQSCDVQVQQHFDLQQKTLFKYILLLRLHTNTIWNEYEKIHKQTAY